MKRAWKVSDAAAEPLSFLTPLSNVFSSSSRSFNRGISNKTPNCCSNDTYKSISLLTERKNSFPRMRIKNFSPMMSELATELTSNIGDSEKIYSILEANVSLLIRRYGEGFPFIGLLKRLGTSPQLALEVFNWRRKEGYKRGVPMVAKEYSKGITIAGRVKNLDAAVELFKDASNKGVKSSSIHNALMAAYMYNGLAEKSQSLFHDFKTKSNFRPTIVTYNILISIFGRMMLVDHMEEIFRETQELNLSPNLSTYNNLIAGYVTAWMWDKMERTFMIMMEGPIKPNIDTHLLMLRGYAHSGNLEKMEKVYESVKDHVNARKFSLVRAMICAYCESLDTDRIRKIEALLKLIPDDEYRPWLNVQLIKVYAQEDLMEGMENSINEALEHKTSITSVHVMRSIIASYFRCNAVDQLEKFVKQAEFVGWRICRSLYHCKMVMYGSQNRLEEMENVLNEMEKFNIDPSKKTFVIMCKAYFKNGQRHKLERLRGAMCKHGFGVPLDATIS